MLLETVKKKLEAAMPGAIVRVVDTSAGHEDHNPGAHVGVTVTWAPFEKMSLVEQHQLIYKALEEEMKEHIHALQIATRIA